MLKKLVALAASLILALIAIPAQAQNIGGILELVVSGSNAIDRAGRNPCSYARGVQQIACQAQRIQTRANDVKAIQRRMAYQAQRSQRRRDVQQGNVNHSRHLINICANGSLETCANLGITQAQATRALQKAGNNPFAARYNQTATRPASDATDRTYIVLSENCQRGHQSACAMLQGS